MGNRHSQGHGAQDPANRQQRNQRRSRRQQQRVPAGQQMYWGPGWGGEAQPGFPGYGQARLSEDGFYFGNQRMPQSTFEALVLSGIRPDLAYLHPGLMQQMQQQAQPPPPEVQHTSTIRSDINLKKDSVVLKQVADADSNHLVEFAFDASVDGTIELKFCATEQEINVDGRAVTQLVAARPELAIPPVGFNKGLGQHYTQSASFPLDITSLSPQDLVYQPDSTLYPLAIVLSAVNDNGESANGASSSAPDGKQKGPSAPVHPSDVQSQTTFCTFAQEHDKWVLKILKQKIMVNGLAYILQEIYGIDQSAGQHHHQDASAETGGTIDHVEDDAGNECVICMSEPRDTTVLPCRHMCLCHECAEVLRHQTNKCPICRAPVQSLLRIKVESNSDDDAEKGET